MEQDDQSEASPSSSKTIRGVYTAGSLLDLKADLLRRTKNLQKTDYSESFVNRTKKNLLLVTKEEKRSQDALKAARSTRIAQNEAAIRKEEEEYRRQKEIMDRKTAAYERLSHGQTLMREDGTAAEFLVNFQEKIKEIEVTDAEKWQKEVEGSREIPEAVAEFRPNPLIVHYDHEEDKGRVFGPSHVKLPHLNEEERERRIRELKEMSEKTKEVRQKRQKQRTEEERAARERINLLRKRKGLPPIESDDESDSPGPSIPADILNIPLPEGEPAQEPPSKKPKPSVREWDKGKIGYGHENWIKKERSKRDDDFAPPSNYYR